MKSNLLYHSDQGWGAFLDFPISGRDFRVTPIVAIDNGDDLIEEYSGFGVRVESRKLGTERLGASFEWSTFDQDWRDATLAALARESRHSRRRTTIASTVTPLVNFAVTRQLSVGGGVGITELDPLSGAPESQMANAVHRGGSGSTRDGSRPARITQSMRQFTVRAASETLESDFAYTRYFGQAEYRYRRSKHTVLASGMVGGIDGDGAALRALFARRFADAARLEQVRHRAGRRRSHVSHIAGVPVSRLRALPRLRLGVGHRHRQARPRRRRIRFPHATRSS